MAYLLVAIGSSPRLLFGLKWGWAIKYWCDVVYFEEIYAIKDKNEVPKGKQMNLVDYGSFYDWRGEN